MSVLLYFTLVLVNSQTNEMYTASASHSHSVLFSFQVNLFQKLNVNNEVNLECKCASNVECKNRSCVCGEKNGYFHFAVMCLRMVC